MRVRIRLFAMVRQQAGWREREFDLAAGSTIEDAWRALVEAHPEVAPSRSIVRFARNGTYTPPEETLSEGDELVIIPPVAGGGPESEVFLRGEITPDPIDDDLLRQLRSEVPTTADGAVVTFVGRTRETPGTPAPGQEAEAARHAGATVTGLEYEAFDEMALTTFRQIADEIGDRFGVRRLAMVHRTGDVPLGEPSVVVVAAAPHRDAAFEACRYAIDELKARAAIWKAEHYADGAVWIGAPAREGEDAESAPKPRNGGIEEEDAS